MPIPVICLAGTALAVALCQQGAALAVSPAPGGAAAQIKIEADLRLAQSQPSDVPKAQVGQSEEARRLVTTAKEKGETELDLVWSENNLRGAEGAKKFESLFNRTYGTNIKVNFTPGPSMTQVAGRVAQEVAAGRRASTDILVGSEGHFGALLNRNVLEQYDYTRLSPRISRALVAPQNIGVEIFSILPGITYNTNVISASETPKKLEDVLNPKWKGKIASSINAAILDRVAMRREWGAERMKAFVARLSQHVRGLIRCGGETSRIASGEFALLAMDCGSYLVRGDQARTAGIPLGHVIPEDAATMGFVYMGVPRNSARPNLAKLFINMLVTEAGQTLIYELDFTDHIELPGSRAASELREVKTKGVDVLRIDAKFDVEHPEMRQLQQELAKLLR